MLYDDSVDSRHSCDCVADNQTRWTFDLSQSLCAVTGSGLLAQPSDAVEYETGSNYVLLVQDGDDSVVLSTSAHVEPLTQLQL